MARDPSEPKSSEEGIRPLRIFVVAGEPSGDRQAAALLRALEARIAPRKLEAWGAGGDKLKAAGASLLFDTTSWAAVGFTTVVKTLPRILTMARTLKRELKRRQPDVALLVDAGGVNVPLGRWIRRNEICPVFYYFPPGSWRRVARASAKRGGLLEAVDRVVTPFPWSAEQLSRQGVDAHFVGHPLLDLVAPTLTDREFADRYGLDPGRPLIALLPGSRTLEIQHILPAMIGAANEIARHIPGVQFALALASASPRKLVEDIVRREQRAGGSAERLQLFMHQAGGRLVQLAQSRLQPPIPRLATNEGLILRPPAESDSEPQWNRTKPGHAPLVICEDITYDVMTRSDLVITKSGTATLEAAILQKPMIVVYRGPAIMELEWRIRRRSLNISHIALPNIIAQERIFPELVQDEASPRAIADVALEMLLQPERLLAAKKRLSDLIAANLGEPGGVARAAELLYETATSNPRRK